MKCFSIVLVKRRKGNTKDTQKVKNYSGSNVLVIQRIFPLLASFIAIFLGHVLPEKAYDTNANCPHKQKVSL